MTHRPFQHKQWDGLRGRLRGGNTDFPRKYSLLKGNSRDRKWSDLKRTDWTTKRVWLTNRILHFANRLCLVVKIHVDLNPSVKLKMFWVNGGIYGYLKRYSKRARLQNQLFGVLVRVALFWPVNQYVYSSLILGTFSPGSSTTSISWSCRWTYWESSCIFNRVSFSKTANCSHLALRLRISSTSVTSQ